LQPKKAGGGLLDELVNNNDFPDLARVAGITHFFAFSPISTSLRMASGRDISG
jgi:hypothetical protein